MLGYIQLAPAVRFLGAQTVPIFPRIILIPLLLLNYLVLHVFLFTAAPPGNARRFSVNLVGESVRRFFLTLWNTYNFFVTYANIDKIRPDLGAYPEAPSELDRWILSELNTLIDEATACLDGYNPTEAARRIEGFVDILSTWYVRRSRRRFWKSEDDNDKRSAYQTLYNCLVTISRLIAPFTPFLAEELYQNLVRSLDNNVPDSVHLESFPIVDPKLIDSDLVRTTRMVMRIAGLGRSARSKAQMKIRQPLGNLEIKVRSQEEAELLVHSIGYILEELNVKELHGAIVWSEEQISNWFEYKVRPNLALLGGKYGSKVKDIVQHLGNSDPSVIAEQVRLASKIWVGDFELLPEEISVSQSDEEGWVSASEGGYGVRLSIGVTPELIQEGLARELVHRIQNVRRSAGFNIEDRIVTFYQASEQVRNTMTSTRFEEYISGETLSDGLVEGPAPEGAYFETQELEGETLTLGVQRNF
ncbi:class I tRNA ligase family protein [SAR202 cluster bacterium AD-802-E10_MRT_200m]|nr:class I tRNA ligase family protein [SAR202 cluster bacterium AD-802-E10_MRT_200m]